MNMKLNVRSSINFGKIKEAMETSTLMELYL